jgi:hypothetical protein
MRGRTPTDWQPLHISNHAGHSQITNSLQLAAVGHSRLRRSVPPSSCAGELPSWWSNKPTSDDANFLCVATPQLSFVQTHQPRRHQDQKVHVTRTAKPPRPAASAPPTRAVESQLSSEVLRRACPVPVSRLPLPPDPNCSPRRYPIPVRPQDSLSSSRHPSLPFLSTTSISPHQPIHVQIAKAAAKHSEEA